MKKLFTLTGLSLCLSMYAQWDNGPLTTGDLSQNGTHSPVGYEFSELQYDLVDLDTNANAGFSADANNHFMLSDDFRIPDGEKWKISSLSLFAYATGLEGCPVNHFEKLFFFNHLEGETVDYEIENFNCEESNLLRVFNSSKENDLFTTQMTFRKIYEIVLTPAAEINLESGYYSLRFQSVTEEGYTHFYPSVTIAGERSNVTESMAQQSNDDGENWGDVIDMGYNQVPAAQDFPFIIEYSVLGTDEVMNLDNRIKIYPNPVRDLLKISVPQSFNQIETKISLRDMTGKLIRTFEGYQESGYDVSNLPKGTYIVEITDGKNRNSNKLMKN